MTRPTVVGVDIGSAATRAVAIEPGGRVVATSEVISAPSGLPVGEADPQVWLTEVIEAVRRLGSGPPEALGIGGQGPTTVLSGARLALTYQHPSDGSSDFEGRHLDQAEALIRRFGDAGPPRQLWDYLAAQLGGSTDTQTVWPGRFPLAGFGEAVPVGEAVGVTSGSEGLPAGIYLVPAANDAFLAAWGSSIDRPGKGYDPGGRTGGLGVAFDARHLPALAEAGVPGHVRGLCLSGGPVAAHGSALEWWSRTTGRSLPGLLESAEKVPPGSEGVIALPYFDGERAPLWNPRLRAEIQGLSLRSDPGVIARALLESTAYGLAHVARGLAEQGATMDRMVSSGTPAGSRLWVSIKASVLGVPVEIPACLQTAAYGAALAAGSARGWWPRPGEGKAGDWPSLPSTVVNPEPSSAYTEGLERFLDLSRAAGRRDRKG